jgi:small ligand-binding sensory domain FIST
MAIGCVAQAIVAGRQEIDDEPAAAVWLASGSGGLLSGYRFDRTAHDLHLLLAALLKNARPGLSP